MSNFIDSVLARLRSTDKPFDKGTGEFTDFNVEAVKSELLLEERAASMGQRGTPGPRTQRKDSLATEIDRCLTGVVSLAQSEMQSRKRAVMSGNNRKASNPEEEIKQEIETAFIDLKTSAKHYFGELFTLRRAWSQGNTALKKFRERNEIEDTSRHPTNDAGEYDPTNSLGFIFFFAAVELLVNAWTLRDGHPEGISGVAIEVLMFTTVNVLLAFILGMYVWRGFYHISFLRKLTSAILSSLLITCICFLNFFFGHYRDALSQMERITNAATFNATFQQLGQNAVEAVITNPIALADIKSMLLVAAGLIAAFFATLKSFELDDPYPGYGKLSRAQAKLQSLLNARQTDAFDELTNTVEATSKAVMGSIDRLGNRAQTIEERDSRILELNEKYQSWLTTIEAAGHSLYSFYRDVNIENRNDGQTPQTFNSQPYKLPSGARDFKLSATVTSFSNPATLRRKFSRQLTELGDACKKYQDEFRHLEQLDPEEFLDPRNELPPIFRD